MRTRFIAVVSSDRGDTAAHVERFRSTVMAQAEFTLAFDRGRLLVAVAGAPVIKLGDRGLILGALFRLGVSSRLLSLSKGEQSSIAGSGGKYLVDAYWGPYVAFLTDDDAVTVRVLRAPLGELPCYTTERDGVTILASDVDALVAFGLFSRSIAWPALARHLAARDVRHTETCLTGLEELPGGCRRSFGAGGEVSDMLWSPWSFCARDRQFGTAEDAAKRVGDTVVSCIAKRASGKEPVLLLLSGGLDSSIVAACLARQGCSFAGLNLVTTDAAGDERHFARLVASALKVPLTERLRDVRHIRIAYSAAARLPRPSTRVFLQESRRRIADAARAVGASAIFNGGGGDNVFGSLHSVAPAVDRLHTTGFDRRFWGTAADISRVASASLWAVTTGALKRAWRPLPPGRRLCDTRFLTSAAMANADLAPTHPWLQAPSGVLPGSVANVRSIAFAQSYIEGLDPQDELSTIAPLLSQPIVEDCLRVPSWLLLADGRNRAIARQAFASDLPPEIILRSSKGRPDSFSAEIFETYRAEIRNLLLDGILVAQDVIDRAAIASLLDDSGPLRGDAFHRLLDFVDAEAWARAVG